MGLTEGMDPGLVREVAASLRGCSRRVAEVQRGGDVSAGRLEEHWHGGDAGYLLERWHRSARDLDAASDALDRVAAQLVEQAQSQEGASGDGGAVGSSGDEPHGDGDTAGPTGSRGGPSSSGSIAQKAEPSVNPPLERALAFAPVASVRELSDGAADAIISAKAKDTNPPWDVDPETGTAIINGRSVPNAAFAGRVYGGPDWTRATAEETGPEWTTTLQGKYPDGVEFTAEGFPLFYPYVHPDHEPVTIELGSTSSKDIRNAYEAAGISREDARALQKDWVWHHTHVYDPETQEGELILIPRDVHAAVKHAGGRSLHKHNGAETSD